MMKTLRSGICVVLMLSAAAWAMPLGSSARTVIPSDIQQIISVDYRALKNSDTAMALKQQVLPPSLKEFEGALRGVGIDPDKDVEQLTFASYRSGKQGVRVVGIAPGVIDRQPDWVEALDMSPDGKRLALVDDQPGLTRDRREVPLDDVAFATEPHRRADQRHSGKTRLGRAVDRQRFPAADREPDPRPQRRRAPCHPPGAAPRGAARQAGARAASPRRHPGRAAGRTARARSAARPRHGLRCSA